MDKQEIKNKIIEREMRANGFDKLCGVGVSVKNLRITKTKAVADIILHTDLEAGISERYDKVEYPFEKLLKQC